MEQLSVNRLLSDCKSPSAPVSKLYREPIGCTTRNDRGAVGTWSLVTRSQWDSKETPSFESAMFRVAALKPSPLLGARAFVFVFQGEFHDGAGTLTLAQEMPLELDSDCDNDDFSASDSGDRHRHRGRHAESLEVTFQPSVWLNRSGSVLQVFLCVCVCVLYCILF